MGEFIHVEEIDSVGIVRIDRPKVNAFSVGLLDELAAEFAMLSDSSVRAVMLWGGEKLFSAGADIEELGTPEAAQKTSDAFRRATLLIETFPRIVIVGIAGFCLGGGLEVALAGDFRVAEESAQLGTPEIKRGLLPGGGATARLPQLLGEQRARQLLLTGESINAVTAAHWGLVDRVVGNGEIYEKTLAWAQEFASAPTTALAHMKSILHKYRTFGVDNALIAEQTAFIDIFRTNDAAQGLRAFREKTEPKFSGD